MRRCVFVWVSGLVVVLDQWSKWWAVENLTLAFTGGWGQKVAAHGMAEKIERFLWLQHPPRSAPIEVLRDFWHFNYVENPGAAWGFLADSAEAFRTPFFLIVSLLAMVFILFYYRHSSSGQHYLRAGLMLVFGGAIGNFLDRVRLGYVIDFIEWHWYDKAYWPTFNIADAAISIGVGFLLLDMLHEWRRERASAIVGHQENG